MNPDNGGPFPDGSHKINDITNCNDRDKKVNNVYPLDGDTTSCDICGKIFSGVNQKFLIRRHRLTHTGERKFSCHLCPYQANQSGNLTRHLRFVHHTSQDSSRFDSHEEHPKNDPVESKRSQNVSLQSNTSKHSFSREKDSNDNQYINRLSLVANHPMTHSARQIFDSTLRYSTQMDHSKKAQLARSLTVGTPPFSEHQLSLSNNIFPISISKLNDRKEYYFPSKSSALSEPSSKKCTNVLSVSTTNISENSINKMSTVQSSNARSRQSTNTVDDSIICLDSPSPPSDVIHSKKLSKYVKSDASNSDEDCITNKD